MHELTTLDTECKKIKTKKLDTVRSSASENELRNNLERKVLWHTSRNATLTPVKKTKFMKPDNLGSPNDIKTENMCLLKMYMGIWRNLKTINSSLLN